MQPGYGWAGALLDADVLPCGDDCCIKGGLYAVIGTGDVWYRLYGIDNRCVVYPTNDARLTGFCEGMTHDLMQGEHEAESSVKYLPLPARYEQVGRP